MEKSSTHIKWSATATLIGIILGIIITVFIITTGSPFLSKTKESLPLGILIEKITNNSDAEVVVFNAFTSDFLKIAPHETQTVNSWLPNANVKTTVLKIITHEGSIREPGNRFIVIHTKQGVTKITFGLSVFFKTGSDTHHRIWMQRNGKIAFHTLPECAAIQDTESNVSRTITIDELGNPKIDSAHATNCEASSTISSTFTKWTEFDWYKFRLSEDYPDQLPEFLRYYQKPESIEKG